MFSALNISSTTSIMRWHKLICQGSWLGFNNQKLDIDFIDSACLRLLKYCGWGHTKLSCIFICSRSLFCWCWYLIPWIWTCVWDTRACRLDGTQNDKVSDWYCMPPSKSHCILLGCSIFHYVLFQRPVTLCMLLKFNISHYYMPTSKSHYRLRVARVEYFSVLACHQAVLMWYTYLVNCNSCHRHGHQTKMVIWW